MFCFKFKDETFMREKQKVKTLAIRDLSAKIDLDDKVIGVINCFYFDSYLLFHVDYNFINWNSDVVTDEEIKFINESGVVDEDEYFDYIHDNYLTERDYFEFLDENEIDSFDAYLKKGKNVLYIKEIRVGEEFNIQKVIEDLKHTMYVLFDYKDFMIINSKGNIISEQFV